MLKFHFHQSNHSLQRAKFFYYNIVFLESLATHNVVPTSASQLVAILKQLVQCS